MGSSRSNTGWVLAMLFLGGGCTASVGSRADTGSPIDARVATDSGVLTDAGVGVDVVLPNDLGVRFDSGVSPDVPDGGEGPDVDPADVDPADVDPADVDPVDADPADVDPADADPADVDPADADPADAELDSGVSPDSGVDAGDGGLPPGTYTIDFETATFEDPLSAGGVWSNNTQGVGGNVAPLNFTSMRVGLASDGLTGIAYDNHGGIEYDDSFAFVPGYTGDQFIEAVIYKEPGYNANAAGSNHELELILGCSTASGTRIWNEFLFNSGGGVDILYLDGGPSDFQSIANVGGISGVLPNDGDVVRATRVGNVLSLYLNGVLWAAYDGSNPGVVAQGSGIGIAAFIRPGATHNAYGFRRVTLGPL